MTVESARSFTSENGPRILLAEDDDEMRILLAWSLVQEGYRVTECHDGLHLLDHIDPRLAPSAADFDLIVTDVRMPDLSGLEVVKLVQQKAQELPPIIVITAFGDRKLHREARKLGVAAVFDKPFEIADLLDKVSEILGETRKPPGSGSRRAGD